MQIFKIEEKKFVIVDTDIGQFRVWKTGIDVWDDDGNGGNWTSFDPEDFEDGVEHILRTFTNSLF